MRFKKPDINTPMLRATAKRKHSLPIICEFAVFLLVFLASQILCALITKFFGTASSQLSPLDLYLTLVTVTVVLVYCLVIEGRNPLSMGFVRHNAVAEYFVGFAFGLLMFGAVVLISLPFRAINLTLTSNLPALIPTLLLFLGGFVIQGFSEELLCRSYLLNSLFPKSGAPLAIAVSSVAFSLLHIGNAAVTPIALVNVALFGVFAGIYFLRRGSIWGIAALHSAWNFAEGNIFGVRVSGAQPQASVFNTTADGSMWLINGGDFGAEGGLAVTVVLTIATIAVYCIPITHKK